MPKKVRDKSQRIDLFRSARERLETMQAWAHPELREEREAFRKLLAGADLEAITAQLGAAGSCVIESKYFDIVRHTLQNVRKARAHRLHTSSGKRVLDLGAGAGFFCYAATLYGHEAVAIQPLGIEYAEHGLYRALLTLFGIPVSSQAIIAQQPIACSAPVDGRFDLVTGFAILFNRKGMNDDAEHWTTEDYLFFLDDLRANLLAPGGRVVLKFHGPLYGDEGDFGVERSDYYRALGELLLPFRISHHHWDGTVLDLFRPSAWKEAQRVTLPSFRISDERGSQPA